VQEQEERQRELRERLQKEQRLREQEQRQRELRGKLAEAQISNARGLQDAESLFGPVPDYVERRRPITRLFFSVYDNLGSLIAINLFTLAPTIPLLLVLLVLLQHPRQVGGLLPLLVVGVIAAPAWGAASAYCARVVDGEMHALGDFWRDYRRLFGRSVVLAAGQWFVSVALVYATFWYLGQHATALKIVGITCLYIFLFWTLIGLYLWPLMVRGYRPRAILRNALVLVVAGPGRTLGVFIVLLVCSIILLFTGIGLVLLLFGLWAILPNQALVLTRERMEARAAAKSRQ